MANTTVKSKVVFKDLGDPAKVKDVKDAEQLLLGTIIGSATGIKLSKGADGITEFKGLKGTFEATPSDPERDIIRSGVAFLGDAFQADIVALLESDNPPESVAFAFEVYSVKATNAAKYSWALRPMISASANDPLAAIKAQMLEAQKTAQAAITSDAKKK